MKFYTDIGRNVSILNNLKIKKNGKIIITINKKEINNNANFKIERIMDTLEPYEIAKINKDKITKN